MASDVSTAKIEQTVLLHHRATKESQDLQRAGWQLMCRLKNLVYYIPFQEKERKRTKKGRKGRPQNKCTLALYSRMKVQRLSGKPSATQRLLIPPGALLQFSPHHTTTKAAMQARINFMVELKKILLQLPAGKSCCLESCYLKTWRFRRMVSKYFDQATILVLDRHFLQE